MISTNTLRTEFFNKGLKEDSLDAAFTKATWVAYKQGALDALESVREYIPNEEYEKLKIDMSTGKQ